MNITLKNVPDPIYKIIKREAKLNRRSLNAEAILALEDRAAEAERRRRLRAARKEFDRLASLIGPLDDSARLIRQERERH